MFFDITGPEYLKAGDTEHNCRKIVLGLCKMLVVERKTTKIYTFCLILTELVRLHLNTHTLNTST